MRVCEGAPEMQRLYVAPHADDVALSCGGAVAIDARTTAPTIVTVFAGHPTGPLGEFAEMQHERWGTTRDGVADLRRDEDRCATRALGAQVKPIWLDELDAIYRDGRYDSDDALFGKILDPDLATISRVVHLLAELHADELVVPLAVGQHVDHQIVLRAARRVAASGVPVWAYADIPYALDRRALSTRIGSGVTREVRLIPLDDEAFERKCQAIDCYASQLPVIFRGRADFRDELDRFDRWIGGGQRAEVQWRVVPSRLTQ